MLQALDLFQCSAEFVEDNSHLDILRLGNHLMEICQSQDWTCRILQGTASWMDTITEQKGWPNPTFDPEKSPVDRTNSASIIIHHRSGDFVACNAFRLFRTDSFKDVLTSGDLFYGPAMRLLNGLQVILPDDFPDLVGRIGYSGGTLISPGHRGKRLGLMTTRLVRVLAQRLFHADHHAGHIFQNLPSNPWPRNPYHFARCTPCLPNLDIPDRHQDQLLFLVDISQAEFLAQVRRNVRKLVSEGNKTLDDLALLAA